MSPLDHLAERVAADHAFLAHSLTAYQRREGLTDEKLAGRVGCPVGELTRLRLRGRPRVDHFADDCRALADRFGLRVEVIEDVCWP